MVKVKSEDYDNAITHFKNSYEFFKENDWIDKYKSLNQKLLAARKQKCGICHAQ